MKFPISQAVKLKGTTIANLHFLFKRETLPKGDKTHWDERVVFLRKLLKRMPNLPKNLLESVYGENQGILMLTKILSLKKNSNSHRIILNKEPIAETAAKTITVCKKNLPSLPPTEIIVFPRFKKLSDGVDGYCVHQNLVFLFLNPGCHKKSALRSVLAHEYFHSVHARVQKMSSHFLGRLIEEGLAMNFSEDLFPNPSIKLNFSKSEALMLLKKLLSKKKVKEKLLIKIVQSDGSLTALGYFIGYHIVKTAIKLMPHASWTDLVLLPPKIIFDLGYQKIKKERR